MMPAFKGASEIMGDHIVQLSPENEFLKSIIGS